MIPSRTMADPDSAANEASPPVAEVPASAAGLNAPNDGKEDGDQDAASVHTTTADLFSQTGGDSPSGLQSKQHMLGLDINYPWGWSGSSYDDYEYGNDLTWRLGMAGSQMMQCRYRSRYPR